MVVHSYNPRPRKLKVEGGSGVSGQSGLLSETLPPKQKEGLVGRLSFTAYRLLGGKERLKSELQNCLRQGHLSYPIWELYCNLWTAGLLKMDHLLFFLHIFFKW